METDTHQKFNWTGRMETLEDRLVMSADPLGGLLGGGVEHHAILDAPPALDHHQESIPDFWIDDADQGALEDHLRQIDQTLASAHDQTGLDQVRSDYGFTGIGQTVAVIDSGIAYDHYALGDGFGSNYRVVGGWDFTGENDANPYDDGPSGSHGTHVSGIIGSSDSTHEGVAPGVDLVGLRVFDDVGSGYFSWVENALDWVHANRNSFENPITTVNLSLGVASWNADTIPNWANLEDEFAQLEADGIFISVSAGNSYSSFNTAGLSYPAASSHVVPVMSTDDSGLLSYFSQRHSRAIAAPGRWVTSTVPDYKGDNDGTTDDFATYSGTSMAAPYVAGASVIVREAMEFSGYTNITQDTIYDHMIATADSFYDSATNAWYDRLNLEAAIDALMPVDDFGSTEAAAYNLGMIGDTMSMSGAITTLGDIDYFSFTAENTGTVSFTASNMTHELDALWHVSGGTGTWSGDSNEILTVDVAAGQTYAVCLSTDNGLGYYNIDIIAESSFSFTDWGAVAFNQLDGISVAGESWYRVEATSAGYLTAEGLFNSAGGQVSLQLYNSNLQLIDTGNAVNGTSRVDTYASAGDELFLKVLGTNSDVDFRLTNLVSLVGTTVNVAGTAGDDAFSFAAGNTHQVAVNGVSYSFAAISVTNINFTGGTGNDSIVMTGTTSDETATLRVGKTTLAGSGFTATAEGVENAAVHGGGGQDVANLYDSAGDDQYEAWSDRVLLTGTQFVHEARDFDHTNTHASSGTDGATFHDGAGYDVLVNWSSRAVMYGTGYFNDARGFDTSTAYSVSGSDLAILYDSAGDDTYEAWSDRSVMHGTGYTNDVHGFSRVNAYATGGTDAAIFHDTLGNDTYLAWSDRAVMHGSGYFNDARNFESTISDSTSGVDRAFFFDSAANDVYVSWSNRAVMTGNGYHNEAQGFGRTSSFSTAGEDIAIFHDSAGDDTYVAWSHRAVLYGNGFFNKSYAFAKTYAYASAGNDLAVFYDSTGDDTYLAWSNRSVLHGDGFLNDARNFSRVYANSTAGNDRAIFYDSVGDDLYQTWSNRSIMAGVGYFNSAKGFQQSYAYASEGIDRAIYYDSSGDDDVYALAWGTYLTDGKFCNESRGFDRVSVYQQQGGNDTAHVDETDYVFELLGNWS